MTIRRISGGGLYIQSGGAQLLNNAVVANKPPYNRAAARTCGAECHARTDRWNDRQELRRIDGAGVFVQSGQFKQSGGVIYGNTASNWGGGMLIGSGGTIKTQPRPDHQQ